MKKTFDIMKLIAAVYVIILLSIYVYDFHMNGDNGRYTYTNVNDGPDKILDTKTGKLYYLFNGRTEEQDLLKGRPRKSY